MQSLAEIFLTQPFWGWMAVAAVLLTIEIVTGTGYLLWPAASAGAVGLLTVFYHPGLPIEVLIFALLTIATTIVGRRYLPHPFRQAGPEVNDRGGRLVGKFGELVQPFTAAGGRVFVDGSEWAAEPVEGAPDLAVGARVEVVEVLGGARVRVKAA